MADLQEKALIASIGASEATSMLLTFAREGALGLDGSPFGPHEPVEHLVDALIATIEIADPDAEHEDQRQLLGALRRYLEGWAP
jgi:hypothetical protein